MNETTTIFKEIWDKLSAVDVSAGIEVKDLGGDKKYSYLPWAKAWEILVKEYPGATYEIHSDINGFPCFFNEIIGGFCKTSVTINDVTRSMDLPVLDYSNKAMKAEPYKYKTYSGGEKTVNAINSFEINTTKWRCLVKNFAMFGLGIKIFMKDGYQNQNDEELTEDWAVTRNKKIGGNGKHKEETWAGVDVSFLYWCIDPGNVKFAKRLAPKAQRELDFRSDDTFNNAEEDKSIGEDSLKFMRQDVQALVDDVLLNKYEYDIRHEDFTRLVKESITKDNLTLISERVKAVDDLVGAFKNKTIGKEDYTIYFNRITIAGLEELIGIVSDIHATNSEGDENRKQLEHYWKLIEDIRKDLGYDQNASLSINSMKKHLKTDDMYTITNWDKLKKYYEYLQTKPKVRIEKPKTTIKEIAPNAKENEIDIG